MTKTRRTPAWWLFWGSVGLILYTYIGFLLVVALRGLLWPRSVRRGSDTPKLSIIIAAYNEAEVILEKLENTFTLNYPRSCMEIIVASDGSDDGTNELVAQYEAPEVRLLALPRRGKNHAINAAVAVASGDILVFTDADSMLIPDALCHLIAPFSDVKVGGVGGDYLYATDVIEGEGERTYWGYERMLKQLQSRADSMTSATGQFYAIRRSLYIPIPIGAVQDDYFISSQALVTHHRLIFEPRAIAYGPIADSAEAEFRRKVRNTTRGLFSVWQVRSLLNPLKYGFLSIQIFSHKILRRLMFVPILTLAITAPALWRHSWLYKLATVCQFGFHGASLLGFLLRNTRTGQLKILSLPFFFNMTYAAVVVALINMLSGQQHDVWTPQQRSGTVEADTTG